MSKQKIYCDSCVFLAVLKEEENRVHVINALFDQAKKGQIQIFTSALTIAEVLNLQGYKSPITKEDREMVRELFRMLDDKDNQLFEIFNVDPALAKRAQDIVWDHGIKPKDAIHVTTALVYEANVFYSYDNTLCNKGLLETNFGRVQLSEPQPPAQSSLL